MTTKVLHIITGLDTGGAETMLCRLISRGEIVGLRNAVVSLTTIGAVGESIRSMGIAVHALHMKRNVPDPVAVVRLARLIAREKPDVIQTWMYHANLVGSIAARIAGCKPVVWGIRHSNLDPKLNRRNTIWTARACVGLSRCVPAAIVCCAEAARRVHANLGYSPEKMVVIPNGFELDRFRPDFELRQSVHEELGIPPGSLVVGVIARFDPQKGHRTFLQAAGRLQRAISTVHFVLCGKAINETNRDLTRWIEENHVHNCHLLGERNDIARLLCGIDIMACSSVSEGFPNVIGEAMACAVPCVVTDCGDARNIVADTGKVVAIENAEQLATGLLSLLTLSHRERQVLGQQARQRIMDNYSLDVTVHNYWQLYSAAIRGAAGSAQLTGSQLGKKKRGDRNVCLGGPQ